MNTSSLRLHILAPQRVRLIAIALFVGISALLFWRQDAGFTRDESFYFHFAESYQEWFRDVEQAEEPDARAALLGPEGANPVWRGNFEHPPLAKQLFGWSWRLFAIKDRTITVPRHLEDGATQLRTTVHLAPAVGFEEGSKVTLLAPLAQGQKISDPQRILGEGLIVARHRHGAELLIEPQGLAPPVTLADVLSLCQPTRDELAPAQLPITRCMMREQRSLAVMDEAAAFRLPGILSGGLAVALTFLLGELFFGWVAGLLGSLLFIFVPEHFFHGFMACFDMPIVAAQLLTMYAFWRSLSDRRWALVAGLAWGLAISTKHNAFFVPFGLLVYWAWAYQHELGLSWVGWRRGFVRLRLPALPLAFLVMPPVALTLLFAFWPRLWHDSLAHFSSWITFHLKHEHYMQYWFGQPLQLPPFPFSYPFEKTWLTYPEVFLALIGVGTFFLAPPRAALNALKAWWVALRSDTPRQPLSEQAKVTIFLLINGLVPILVIAVPSTPIFGGIKHWMTGTPFLAIVAGYGFCRLCLGLKLNLTLTLSAAALCLVHPVKASLDNAWLGTNYYNALFAGGLQGGADNRLMRIFWGHESRYACEWLNAQAPLNASVFWQDTTRGSYEMYKRLGWLRQDIRYNGDASQADIALLEPLQALWDRDWYTQRAMGVAGPIFSLTRHGVPYLHVLAKPELGLTPPEIREP